MSNNDVLLYIKNYMFQPTVAIVRFYAKLYAKKESVYIMCATTYRCWDLIIYVSGKVFLMA